MMGVVDDMDRCDGAADNCIADYGVADNGVAGDGVADNGVANDAVVMSSLPTRSTSRRCNGCSHSSMLGRIMCN